jgi:hypothetical protein
MFKELNKFEKIEYTLINLIRLYMFIALIYFFFEGDIVHIFSVAVSLVGTFAGSIVKKLFKIKLTMEFNLVIVLFIFFSNFLGESHGLFFRFWWWDLIMHTASGLILPFVGLLIFYKLGGRGKALLVALFALFFANFAALMFEFVEFTSDLFFSNLHVMMDDGLVGTIGDLLSDFVGSLVSSAYIYFVLKTKKKSFIFRKMVVEVVEKNKKLF